MKTLLRCLPTVLFLGCAGEVCAVLPTPTSPCTKSVDGFKLCSEWQGDPALGVPIEGYEALGAGFKFAQNKSNEVFGNQLSQEQTVQYTVYVDIKEIKIGNSLFAGLDCPVSEKILLVQTTPKFLATIVAHEFWHEELKNNFGDTDPNHTHPTWSEMYQPDVPL